MTIASALEARLVSKFPSERQRAAKLLPGPNPMATSIPDLNEAAYSALWAVLLSSYAQGFNMLRLSGQPRGYVPDRAAAALVWQSGCIIRSDLLLEIEQVFLQTPEISDLLTAGSFLESLGNCQRGWRQTVGLCFQYGLPVPVISAALTHYDMVRTVRLPTNLIQAQRDFFGAHTYARTDRPGVFHSDWERFAREVHLR
jgi:6-phosphogluconate dehydrogenase